MIKKIAAGLKLNHPHWVVIALISISTPSWALDLVEAYHLALQHDTSWHANQVRRQIDAQDLGIAQSAIFPVVGVNASYYKQYPHLDNAGGVGDPNLAAIAPSNDPITTKQVAVSIQQPLFRWDVWQRYQQVQISQQLSDLTLQQQQQQLMLDVASAYFNVLRQDSLLHVYQQEESALLQQYKMMQAKFREGFIAKMDMNEAQAQYQSTQAKRVAGEVQSQLAREQLAQFIGQYPQQVSTLTSNFKFVAPLPSDISAWTERSAQNNLLVNQRRVAYAVALQQVKVDQADQYPQVQAVASTAWKKQSPSYILSNNGRFDKIGIELNWTPFNSTRNGIINKSRLSAQAAQADIDSALRQVQTQTKQYYLQVTTASSQLNAYRTAMLSAQTVADATQGSYREGLKTMVDVLLAQRNAFAAKQDYVNAQYDYLLNVLNLKAVSGQLDENDLGEINAWLK